MTSSSRQHQGSAQRRRLPVARVLPVLLILAGALVSVWPIGETYLNNYQGSRAVASYGQAVIDAAPTALASDLKKAETYNKTLQPSALEDPWSDETPASSPAHDAYLKQLAELGPLGRIRIPDIDVDLPIQHDATHASLALGAGHMYGTSLPVGGVGTHSVIAAHTGSRVRTFFDRLPELSGGDLFYIDVAGKTLTYRVEQLYVVMPTDLTKIAPVPGRDLVTLVTCRVGADGVNRRLLVRGGRVADSGAAVQAPVPGSPTRKTTSARSTSAQPATATPAPTRAAGAPGAAGDAAGTAVLPASPPQAAATFDTSIQSWMYPRLTIAGGGLFVIAMMCLGWWQSDRRDRAAHRTTLEGNPR